MSSNTKPIGVAFEDQNIIGADFILSDGQLGYTAAAQGVVTQLTDKSTAVTLNRSAGRITMNAASLATATNATFTLNNSLISANDTVILTISGGQATPGSYNVFANALGAGTVSITLRNISGGSLSEAVVINFALIHCV
jgi:predicted ThiF/HesA family dinucleotide-utilizing enzyme